MVGLPFDLSAAALERASGVPRKTADFRRDRPVFRADGAGGGRPFLQIAGKR
jgi:hypothetical protein